MKVDLVFGLAAEFATICTTKDSQRIPQEICHVKWDTPKPKFIKLNTDRANKKCLGLGGIGGTFKDSSGKWIMGFYSALAHTTPIEAEIKAIRKGIQLAI